ncbi:MAG: NAD(P)/FAD-dependent oxidoreductase [Chitinivibrionales bacterium]
MKTKKKRVIILGGGFAGIWAAREICRSRDIMKESALIDRNAFATMLPALPDLVSGRVEDACVKTPLEEILPQGLDLIRDCIESVDFERKKLYSREAEYSFEYLILAAGSKVDFHGFNPQGHVYTLDCFKAAKTVSTDLRRYLEERGSESRVVIAGAGYTGVELAFSIRWYAEKMGIDAGISLLNRSESYLKFLSVKDRGYAKRLLDKKNIEIITGVTPVSAEAEELRLSSGKVIKNPFFCWTAGVCLEPGFINNQVERLPDGRVGVDRYLEVPDYPGVFAAGDSAGFMHKGAYLRRAVNYACYSGKQAGKNCVARISSRRMQEFKPVDAGWVIPLSFSSIGRVLGKIPVKGRAGLFLHYFMCGYRSFNLRRFICFIKRALTSLF